MAKSPAKPATKSTTAAAKPATPPAAKLAKAAKPVTAPNAPKPTKSAATKAPKKTPKVTSTTISQLASDILHDRIIPTIEQIKSIAASALGQDKTKGDKPKGKSKGKKK